MSNDSADLGQELIDQRSVSGEIEKVFGRILECTGDEDTSGLSQASKNGRPPTSINIDSSKAQKLYEDLKGHFQAQDTDPTFSDIKDIQGDIPQMKNRPINVERANACKIHPADSERESDGHQLELESGSVNLIVTSPPYWQLRDYGVENQIGQEEKPEEYVRDLVDALDVWEEFLHPKGSVFLNIGDKYQDKSLVGIPGMFAERARKDGWTIRNHIIWTKENGLPSPAKDRLVPRHEHIFHLVRNDDYYYDLFGYSQVFGNGANPGDVWNMSHDRNTGDHLAPFPSELVFRAVTLACPPAVCSKCGEPHTREIERPLKNLNQDRPQARRALEKFEESDLTMEHLKAIRAVGISDTGKAKQIQNDTGTNNDKIQEQANEAKEVLGGYFREFTFPLPTTVGWSGCECDVDPLPGMVFDPFTGSGTTINTAYSLGYQAWGTDLDRSNFEPKLNHFTEEP